MDRLHEIADRIAIDALRAEFSDAAMMNDHERLISLFAPHGEIRIPDANVHAAGREGLRTLCEQREERMEVFVQTTHPGVIELAGDTASGRAYMSELIRLRDGGSHRNLAIYHDKYQRTVDGWRFTERVYEIRYLDTSALPGVAGRPLSPDSEETA